MNILFILDYKTYKDNLFETALKASYYADKIWFRIKDLDSILMLNLAFKLKQLLPTKDLIISERADIALITQFKGVHLGSNSIPPDVIKSTFPSLTVGYSAHSLDEICSIEADYYTLSPIFYTKKDYQVSPLGLIDVSSTGKKIYALGGINKENVKSLIGLGYYGFAGISFLNDLQYIKSFLK